MAFTFQVSEADYWRWNSWDYLWSGTLVRPFRREIKRGYEIVSLLRCILLAECNYSARKYLWTQFHTLQQDMMKFIIFRFSEKDSIGSEEYQKACNHNGMHSFSPKKHCASVTFPTFLLQYPLKLFLHVSHIVSYKTTSFQQLVLSHWHLPDQGPCSITCTFESSQCNWDIQLKSPNSVSSALQQHGTTWISTVLYLYTFQSN